MLHGVVCVLRIGLHGDLSCTGGAAPVEAEDLDAQVGLSRNVLLGRIELGALVHVVPAGAASAPQTSIGAYTGSKAVQSGSVAVVNLVPLYMWWPAG